MAETYAIGGVATCEEGIGGVEIESFPFALVNGLAMELGRLMGTCCWVGMEAGADSVRTLAPKDEHEGEEGRDERREEVAPLIRLTEDERAGDPKLDAEPLDSQDCRCLATGAGSGMGT